MRMNNINNFNNNLYKQNNNINSININNNKNDNSLLQDLVLDIETECLKKLSREYLIDIILFLRNIIFFIYCNLIFIIIIYHNLVFAK